MIKTNAITLRASLQDCLWGDSSNSAKQQTIPTLYKLLQKVILSKASFNRVAATEYKENPLHYQIDRTLCQFG